MAETSLIWAIRPMKSRAASTTPTSTATTRSTKTVSRKVITSTAASCRGPFSRRLKVCISLML